MSNETTKSDAPDDERPCPSARQYLIKQYNEQIANSKAFEFTYKKLHDQTTLHAKEENLTKFHAFKSFERNRYRDVLAYDHSRVRLMDPVDDSDYVNANYIHAPDACRKYICTQGPLPQTVEHFWQMVYEQNTYAIIMVTRCKENNMIKVYPYYPTHYPDDAKYHNNDQVQFGRYRITLISEEKSDRFISRRLRLDVIPKENIAKNTQGQWSTSEDEDDIDDTSSNNSESSPIDSPSKRRRKASSNPKMEVEPDEASSSSEQRPVEIVDSREIRHFQFIDWHDYNTPDDLDSLLHFLTEVRKSGLLNANEYGPPVVHCSAGIGRTGTFILVDTTLAMLSKSDTWKPTEIDPNEQLVRYRQSRVGLVQTPGQLRFAWMCIYEAIQHEKTKWKELMELSNIHDASKLGQPPMLRSVAAVKTDGNLCTSMDESMFDVRRASSTSIDRRSTISSQPKWLETGTPESQVIRYTNKSHPPESVGTEHAKSKVKLESDTVTFLQRTSQQSSGDAKSTTSK